MGITGKDVKVAILDMAFDTSNRKISSNIQESKSFRHDLDNSLVPVSGFRDENKHGTAVAEIITDVAPDVDLYLYTIQTELEFEEAVEHVISKDIDLIAMSAGWINYPTDGSSSMTKKVEEAISNGISFVVSAGNYAETHWEGKFVDSDRNGMHQFSGTDEGLSITVTEDRVSKEIPLLFSPNLACFASLRESSFSRFRNPTLNQKFQICLVGNLHGFKYRSFF